MLLVLGCTYIYLKIVRLYSLQNFDKMPKSVCLLYLFISCIIYIYIYITFFFTLWWSGHDRYIVCDTKYIYVLICLTCKNSLILKQILTIFSLSLSMSRHCRRRCWRLNKELNIIFAWIVHKDEPCWVALLQMASCLIKQPPLLRSLTETDGHELKGEQQSCLHRFSQTQSQKNSEILLYLTWDAS